MDALRNHANSQSTTAIRLPDYVVVASVVAVVHDPLLLPPIYTAFIQSIGATTFTPTTIHTKSQPFSQDQYQSWTGPTTVCMFAPTTAIRARFPSTEKEREREGGNERPSEDAVVGPLPVAALRIISFRSIFV